MSPTPEEGAPKEAPLLQVEELKTYFHTFEGVLHAVDGVTFSVYSGRTWGSSGRAAAARA